MPLPKWLNEEALRRAIRHVHDGYKAAIENASLERLERNRIDPWGLLFELSLSDKSIEDWLSEEEARQLQKTINQAVGEFHQILLGNCEGWEDLGVGDDSKLDVSKRDDSIFAEIKNKYNTMNSDAENSVFTKMHQIRRLRPETTVYLVQIVPRISCDRIWKKKKNTDEKLRRISGDVFYEMVTGQKNALYELAEVLPESIKAFVAENKIDSSRGEEILRGELETAIGGDVTQSSSFKYFLGKAYLGEGGRKKCENNPCIRQGFM